MTAKRQDIALDPDVMRAPLFTRRLFLRPPCVADIPALTRLINDPSVARNTSRIPHPYSAAEAWRFLRARTPGTEPPRSAGFLVTLRGNPRLIAGGAGLDWGPHQHPELGYWIAAGYRRRGFASELARALLDRAFSTGAVQLVEAWARTGNIASQRVLRRAGFRRVGAGTRPSRMLRRHVPVTHFALSRADWAALSGREP